MLDKSNYELQIDWIGLDLVDVVKGSEVDDEIQWVIPYEGLHYLGDESNGLYSAGSTVNFCVRVYKRIFDCEIINSL